MSTHKTVSLNWNFRDGIEFLNHGSFGACPLHILHKREKLLKHIESNPMDFMLCEYQPLLISALQRVSAFTGAEPDSIVFVENATTGINTILRNLPIRAGDSILVTDHEYFSSMNSLKINAARRGATIKVVDLPFPVGTESELVKAFTEAVTPSTRYALLDHIVSSTGVVLPLKRIIKELSEKGVETIVDGAHGPGQVELDLKNLGCIAYVGNCHKWLCSPRSSAILYVSPSFQKEFLPLAVSHLPSDFKADCSDFQLYFRWNGTPDPTPALSVPATIDFMETLHPEGWQGIMTSNRELALNARETLCSVLGIDPPCPDSMVGSMAAIILPGYSSENTREPSWIDPLQKWLRETRKIEVPVTAISPGPKKLLRISAQLYNSLDQYSLLAESLKEYISLYL